MKLHLAQLPKLIAERRSSAIFGMVIVAMLWGGICLKYFENVRNDQREAERTSQNFAMVFEENVLRSIGEIDKALLYLRRSIETRKDTTDFHTIANTADVLSEIIVQVAIIDANGIMRASNAGPQPAPAMDLSDREHYLAHRNSTEDRLFISRPLVGRVSRQWSVQFTRRFLNSDQSFGGVVVASLNPEHLTNFYNKIDFGSTASISLIGADGVVRSSGGYAGFDLGQDLTSTPLFPHMQTGMNATFENTDARGEARLVTLRKVRGQPLWVSVSIDQKEILRSSWTDLQLNAIAGLVLTLIILGAMERILQTEARARQKAEQLQLTLENMSQGIMLVTNDLQIPIINARCAELLDLPAQVINNPPRYDQLLAGEGPLFADPVTVLDSPASPGDSCEISGRFAVSERPMPNGRVIEIRSGHLPDGSLVQTFTDVTKRHEAEAHVQRLASEDPLTSLPNRRVFRSRVEEICREQTQHDDASDGIKFAVLFLDLDRFKVINDTLGHRVGDMLLQHVAKRLQAALPESHVLARLGGDEFAVVVPAVETRAALEGLAKHIISTVARPYDIDGYRILSGVSVGIAIGPTDGRNVDDLLMAADLALYAVKGDSRGAYKFYHRSMNTNLNDRRQIEIDLREAIERNDLQLHYQPIISLQRNVVTGFEALTRWRHPVKGMIPPASFIPVAEDTGLILQIGEWALREACSQAAHWPGDLKIAVNISPVQLLAPNLSDMIQRTLLETGLAPHRLELEITERIFMEDNEHTLATLRRLKEIGVRIAMDDFGTGYSSLSYLRSFPFDKIKIDRAFVSDLAAGTEHVVIVQAVISIARALGMTTTAEGVEIADQQQFLAEFGCDEAQGYLFSPAVPIEKVGKIIADWSAGKSIAA